jgi:DNA photolyase
MHQYTSLHSMRLSNKYYLSLAQCTHYYHFQRTAGFQSSGCNLIYHFTCMSLFVTCTVYPVFMLDPHFANAETVGQVRYAFLLECLTDLDTQLKALGSRLFVVQGKPEEQFPTLFRCVLIIINFFSIECSASAKVSIKCLSIKCLSTAAVHAPRIHKQLARFAAHGVFSKKRCKLWHVLCCLMVDTT